MKFQVRILCFGLLFVLMGVNGWGNEKKSLVIMLDGLRADTLYSAPTPNINALMNGSWDKDYRCTWCYQAHTNLDAPPSSATNHVAIATGVTATKNNVFQNGKIKEGKYTQYPTYLARLKKYDSKIVTAWLYNWQEDADLVTESNFQLGSPTDGQAGDNYLIDQAILIMNGSMSAMEGAKKTKWIPGTDIDCMMLYLDSMDIFGHGFNFSVFEDTYYNKMIEYDKRLGELFTAVKNRPNFKNENWQIIIVSDHGGYLRSHGIVGCENCYTIPIIVIGKDIKPGRMLGQPQNCDVAAFAMKHITGSIPKEFDGKIADVVIDKDIDYNKGFKAYFPFDSDYKDALGTVQTKISPVPFAFEEKGVQGKCISTDKPGSYIQLDKANLPKGNYSFTLWFKTNGPITGDPPLLSDKQWVKGINPGFALVANYGTPGTTASFNLADGKQRDDLGLLAYPSDNSWTFFGVTVDKKGNAVFYLGDQRGRLAFVSDDISTLKIPESGDWYLHQDGSACYPLSVDGSFDEVGIWDRSLLLEEIELVYKKGLAGLPLKDAK